ncbi:acyl-CoA dehydrogenase family protein [Nocardiopsis lambiniae]|uniref:Acyl-CoA dehydrogenase family protein n=1 Tax=Nocardiopsis lambiniae TaxID=3075539 RepID=A0ABU2M926_9ACTN|nr:acyl-CoA dehydrogenase family protein [Nocardiopsis sp. DSM 44743]MDT0328670.1 acyl-CoA dehydrogenase family protein [Nocardiopsis sp. DSM 44743]
MTLLDAPVDTAPVDTGPADTGPATGGAEPMLAERARRLADRVARPTVAPRDHDRRWDAGLFADLADDRSGPGLAGPLVPLALGGGGLSATQTCALLEGLGEGSRDPGLALAVAAHAVLATVPLRAFGSGPQKKHYLPRMAAGEWVGALSLQQTQGAALASTVTARPAAEGWVLTGALDLVPCAPIAHHLLIIATLDSGDRTAFIVDRATTGLLIEETGPAAMRTCSWGRVVLDDCPVPEDAVLGTVGGAAVEVEPLLATLDWIFTSAPWLGVMRALTSEAVGVARERRLFGRPLAHAQSVRFTLADLAIRCELASEAVYRAAGRFDAGDRASRQDAAATRLFVASAAREVVEGAVRLSGPLALTDDRLMARAHRDVLFFSETGGGVEVLRPVIAASLLGLG